MSRRQGRRVVLVVTGVLALNGCGSGPSGAASKDTASPLAGASTVAASAAQRDGVRQAAEAYAADLTAMQVQGRDALSPGGDVAGFYRSFGEHSKAAADRYGTLDVPADALAVRDKVAALLTDQAQLLSSIADSAAAGAPDAAGAQLTRLTTVMNDVATANAELLRRTGVPANGP